MTKESLKYINNILTSNDIPYQFIEWQDDVTYPYFVGEYTEIEPMNEDGLEESTFMITGTTDKTWSSLEDYKELIREKLCDKTAILPNGNGIAVFYSGSLQVPTGNAKIKRIQINLNVKEWSVK